MIDTSTGSIQFTDPPTTILPALTRHDFQNSSLAEGSTVSVNNEPWCSWNLRGEFADEDFRFALTLYFKAERLTMVTMANVDPCFGTSWEDMTDEKELRRNAAHEQWLTRSLGAMRRFDWGNVFSGRDHWQNPASITIKYGFDR